jgi:hypothetical protein
MPMLTVGGWVSGAVLAMMALVAVTLDLAMVVLVLPWLELEAAAPS